MVKALNLESDSPGLSHGHGTRNAESMAISKHKTFERK